MYISIYIYILYIYLYIFLPANRGQPAHSQSQTPDCGNTTLSTTLYSCFVKFCCAKQNLKLTSKCTRRLLLIESNNLVTNPIRSNPWSTAFSHWQWQSSAHLLFWVGILCRKRHALQFRYVQVCSGNPFRLCCDTLKVVRQNHRNTLKNLWVSTGNVRKDYEMHLYFMSSIAV